MSSGFEEACAAAVPAPTTVHDVLFLSISDIKLLVVAAAVACAVFAMAMAMAIVVGGLVAAVARSV